MTACYLKWQLSQSLYLRLDSQEVFFLSGPELQLNQRAGVVSPEQLRLGVFLQDIPYLLGPLNYKGFYRIQQSMVHWPTGGTEEVKWFRL